MNRKYNYLLGLVFLVFCTISFAVEAQYASDHWEALVLNGNQWAWRAGTSAPNPFWRSLHYDDQNWQHGPGGIGYGDGDDSSTIQPAQSLMLRIRFYVTDTSKIKRLILLADYDDSFVAWLDQIEIARSNIGEPGDIPEWNDTALTSHEAKLYRGLNPESFPVNYTLQKAILNSGWHVLAIQVNNDSILDDLSAIFNLMAIIRHTDTLYQSTPGWFNPPFHTNLPIININTNNQIIPDQPKITASMQVIDNGPKQLNFLNDNPDNYNGIIGIERRGSSSQWFAKKPYSLETRDSLGFERNVSLLGMPKENDWILQNPYSDKSLMRNFLAYRLAHDMGMYSSRTRFCEVWLNGQYQGVYVFMEQLKWDKNRINIEHMDINDNAGDSLSGGYVIKVDKLTGGSGVAWYSPIKNFQGQAKSFRYQFDYPKPSKVTNQQFAYIKTFMDSFEYALVGPDFQNPEKGYRKYINVQTFIDFFIINELTKDVDAYRLSTYLAKPRDSKGGKLVAGPVWDFNLGFGNANYCSGYTTSGWAWGNCAKSSIPFWWERLLQDPDYRQQVACRWTQLRAGVLDTSHIMNMIDQWYRYIFEPARRNFQKWPVIGQYVWPNSFIGTTYLSEINFLKAWIKLRIEWLDANMPHGKDSCLIASFPDQLIITEFNYQSDSSLNGGDWFELYNPGIDRINLSNWQCSDNDYHHRFVFPAGQYIDPGEYLVVCRDTSLFHQEYPGVKNITGPFNWGLGNGGDSIIIYDSLSFKQYAFGYHHQTLWGADGYGRTLELRNYAHGANDPANWFDGCMKGSPGKAFEPCQPELAISEINYFSGSHYPAGDWIEIVNLSPHSIDLSGYYIADKNMLKAYRIPQGIRISPQQYILVSKDPVMFSAVYPQTAYPLGPTPFGLSRRGDLIRLFDANKHLVYSVIYDEKAPWPLAANGWDYTLEQIDFSASPDEGNNWSSHCPGGSPGTDTQLPCKIISGINLLLQGTSVKVFPNPAFNIINIYFDISPADAAMFIMNLQGKIFYSSLHQTFPAKIDISKLAQGVYLLELITSDGIERLKFIKQ